MGDQPYHRQHHLPTALQRWQLPGRGEIAQAQVVYRMRERTRTTSTKPRTLSMLHLVHVQTKLLARVKQAMLPCAVRRDEQNMVFTLSH